MNSFFPRLAMADVSKKYATHDLTSLHNTNPQPFSQIELENIIGYSFSEIIKEVPLGFTPDAGTDKLRKVLADKLYEKISANHIVTHAGAQEALFCAFHALLKKGDSVLVVTPIFEPLVQIPLSLGCEINYTCLDANNRWALDLADVEKYFRKGCKVFVINFPHNPTGAQITTDELCRIVELCKKYNVWLLSDEVFRGLEHRDCYRLPAVADLYKMGISVGVVSKAYAVPGIRVGWLSSRNSDLISKIVNIKSYLSVCNSQIDEKLMVFIMDKHDKLLERNLKIILNNKPLLSNLNKLNSVEVSVAIPKVGCCVFAKIIEGQSINSECLVDEIAAKKGVLFYPSSVFLTKENGMRIGFGNLDFKMFFKGRKKDD